MSAAVAAASEKKKQRFTAVVNSFRDDYANKCGDWVCGYVPLIQALGFTDGKQNQDIAHHLDIGSGKGALCIKLAGLGLRNVTGCDISRRAIEESVRRAQYANLAPPPSFRLVKEGEPLPFPDRTFTSATCCFVLSSMPTRESQVAFLREAAAVLQEGAELAVLVNHPETYGVRFTSHQLDAPSGTIPEEWKPGSKTTIHFYDRFGAPYMRCNDRWWPSQHYQSIMTEAGFEDVRCSSTPFSEEQEPTARRLGMPTDELAKDAQERTLSPVLLIIGRRSGCGGNNFGGGGGGNSGRAR